MVLRDLKRDFDNGLLVVCRVERCMGQFAVKVRYQSGEWEVLELQRDGVRMFSKPDTALKAAESIGFKEVSVLM